jgi:DNA-directed RNA polymerase subunit alpha
LGLAPKIKEDTMLELEKPKVEFVTDEVYGKFTIEPLERGFGTTIGNTLRRILLSSLQGAAVTHVKIEGVLHEFSTIPGVVEDTTEIILNLKMLNLKLYTDKLKVLRLEVQGEGVVTAADIKPDPEVEILNPELKIATLDNKDSKLIMEIRVKNGKGYVSAEAHRSPEDTIGLIPIDSIFTPIKKVTYFVEDTRLGQITNLDRLILEVWTNGSIKPYEAVSLGSQIMQDYMGFFNNLKLPLPGEGAPVVGDREQIIQKPIEDLGLSVRSLNCLRRAGVKTIRDLLTFSEEDILKLKNFGQKSFLEIKEKLGELGITLRQSNSEEELL